MWHLDIILWMHSSQGSLSGFYRGTAVLKPQSLSGQEDQLLWEARWSSSSTLVRAHPIGCSMAFRNLGSLHHLARLAPRPRRRRSQEKCRPPPSSNLPDPMVPQPVVDCAARPPLLQRLILPCARRLPGQQVALHRSRHRSRLCRRRPHRLSHLRWTTRPERVWSRRRPRVRRTKTSRSRPQNRLQACRRSRSQRMWSTY
mmetsp:Transcript_16609/g.39434  ORF Transcript_16609/g.39434 Transcript_16609/m.39434 type:complete len:200 (+) Transcript_16609:222-821(+)